MSSYTKYHRDYQKKHRDEISKRRKKKYLLDRYGIPIEDDELGEELQENKKFYVKLQELNPKLVLILLRKYHPFIFL